MRQGVNKVKDFKDLDEFLQHHGVKGMKWGVRRNSNRPGGADGKPDAKDVKGRNKIGKHLDSWKRERDWSKALKNLDKMSTKDINSLSKRIQLENDLKRLSKAKGVGSSKDKQDYLNRAKMSEQELSRKVVRLRAKENLSRNIREASRRQREVGEKVVKIGSSLAINYAVKKSITPKDIFDSVSNPNQAHQKAVDSVIKKVSNKTPKEVRNSKNKK